MNLTSDNRTAIAPEILEGISRANIGSADAYGADSLTTGLKDKFSEIFEREVWWYPVSTGTAANALCIGQATPSSGATLCHETSHLYAEECGAAELFSGAPMIPIGGEMGKIAIDQLSSVIGNSAIRPTVLSITQPTEFGTVYALDELAALSSMAQDAGLRVHIDGARFSNALVHLDCSPAEATWRCGVDLMAFGATKNGAMCAEAVIIFNPSLVDGIDDNLKRSGHLFSKARFMSAQFAAYLENDLWLKLAANANRMARRLARRLDEFDSMKLAFPVQVNEVFVQMPRMLAQNLHDIGIELEGFAELEIYRFVTSHATTSVQIDDVCNDRIAPIVALFEQVRLS